MLSRLFGVQLIRDVVHILVRDKVISRESSFCRIPQESCESSVIHCQLGQDCWSRHIAHHHGFNPVLDCLRLLLSTDTALATHMMVVIHPVLYSIAVTIDTIASHHRSVYRIEIRRAVAFDCWPFDPLPASLPALDFLLIDFLTARPLTVERVRT